MKRATIPTKWQSIFVCVVDEASESAYRAQGHLDSRPPKAHAIRLQTGQISCAASYILGLSVLLHIDVCNNTALFEKHYSVSKAACPLTSCDCKNRLALVCELTAQDAAPASASPSSPDVAHQTSPRTLRYTAYALHDEPGHQKLARRVHS